MKKSQFILFSLLIMLFSSCYSSKIVYQNLDSIQRGMSPAEVMSILGKPNYRSFDAEKEILEFRDSEYGTAKVVKIWFVDNKVVEMKSYLDRYYDNCHNRIENQTDKKEDQSDKKDTSSKIRTTTDGKHIVQNGSVIITPEGTHEIVVSDSNGLIITATGKHIHTF